MAFEETPTKEPTMNKPLRTLSILALLAIPTYMVLTLVVRFG